MSKGVNPSSLQQIFTNDLPAFLVVQGERDEERDTTSFLIYLFIFFYHLNKMLVNRFKDELNEEELLFIQEIQNTDATLSRSKKLTTRQTLPRRPPESMLPAWVERLHACPEGSPRARRVLLMYRLIDRKTLTAAERQERHRLQVQAWHKNHRDKLLEYNRKRRRQLDSMLKRLQAYEKSGPSVPSSSDCMMSTCFA